MKDPPQGYGVMSEERKSLPPPGDNPIRCPEADLLGRREVAERFARYVRELDASEGATVGVFGPWGSGKTSFIHLARREFEQARIPVLDFNPWLFSGAEQLVERFFAELSAELRLHDLATVSEAFEDYGKAITGRVGVALRVMGVHLRRRGGGIAGLREKIEAALTMREKPIIVILDDVDRLSAQEIREVFKLVRLTASFSNLIYIVACDRLLVEHALDEPGLPGRDYLEKILQFPFDLPKVPRHLLQERIDGAINDALADTENPGPFDEQVWPDIYAEIVRPLIQNMRDVRRYAIAIRETVVALDGRVALADVLGLEAVRVFLPDVFRLLPSMIDSLTSTSGKQAVERRISEYADQANDPNERHKTRVDDLIDAAGSHKEVARDMIRRLFPVGKETLAVSTDDATSHSGEWAEKQLKRYRVSHEYILRIYLERVVGPDLLAYHDAERAVARIAEDNGLEEFFHSLDPARWPDVIGHLRGFQNQFRPDHVEKDIITLLNLLPDIPRALNSIHDPRIAVNAVISRLLNTLEDHDAVESALRRILPRITSLSSKLELVWVAAGHHMGDSSQGLVPAPIMAEIEKMLRDEIRSVSVDGLCEEPYLMRIIWFLKETAESSEEPLDVDPSPKMTFAILRAFPSENTIQSLGSRAVYQTQGLQWGNLVALYGGEATLVARIKELNACFDELIPWMESLPMPADEARQLLETATQYLTGRRPEMPELD